MILPMGIITTIALAGMMNLAEADNFSDADLKKLEAGNRPALIYIWSPDQLYSMKHWRAYYEEAKRQKMLFVAVSKLPISKHQDLKIHRMPSHLFSSQNTSLRLMKSGATLHTPSVMIVENGRIQPFPIIGLLQPKNLASAIRQKRKEASK